MKIEIEIDEKRLRELVLDEIHDKLGSIAFTPDDVKIEVKSKQNYRSEWEPAKFRARIEKQT